MVYTWRMNTAERVLVVILSSALALTLILSIVLLIILIKIFLHIKHLTEKAESFAEKAENIADFFERSAPPIAIARMLGNIGEAFRRTKGDKRRKEK